MPCLDKMQFKVSVIVPVYNVEPYLRRCLDSLVNQTLKDIEIICINDRSLDKSLVILKRYAKKDNRITVIDFNKNQGVSVVRNTGMKIAKGEYIGFCDSDDYVDLDFYEKLYEYAKRKNANIAMGNVKTLECNAKTEITRYNGPLKIPEVFFRAYSWDCIYRNKMLKKHKIKFPEGLLPYEDMCFMTHVVLTGEKIYVLNNAFYHYVKRDDSADSAIFNSKKMHLALKCYCVTLNRLNKAAEKDKKYIAIYTIRFQLFLGLLRKNLEKQIVKKVAKIAIAYNQKRKFPVKFNLPKSIIAAIEIKDEKKLAFLLQKWTYCEFYPFIDIKESILQSRNLYVWGTGEDGIKVKKQCESNGWKIAGFLDSNKSVKRYNEYKVERPEQVLNKPKEDFFIIISSRKYGKEIAGICRKTGLKVGRDFWRSK
jgi:glycosyltransferase involved in cell wall biosynthesis